MVSYYLFIVCHMLKHWICRGQILWVVEWAWKLIFWIICLFVRHILKHDVDYWWENSFRITLSIKAFCRMLFVYTFIVCHKSNHLCLFSLQTSFLRYPDTKKVVYKMVFLYLLSPVICCNTTLILYWKNLFGSNLRLNSGL